MNNNITILPDGTKLQLHKNGQQVTIVRGNPLHRNTLNKSKIKRWQQMQDAKKIAANLASLSSPAQPSQLP